MVTSLVRADEAFSNDELVAWLRRRLEDAVLDVIDEFETLTVVVTPEVWVEAHRICKEDPRLAFTMFDTLFGVDAKEEGFDVVSILYSVEMGRRVLLRTRADGGRENPTLPSLTGLFRGANFHEREQWDMFGIEFEGHPGLAPRIFTSENFEGWPLRKDFHLATREAKPWPGVKEPAETDEDGNIIEKVPGIGEAVGPMPLDELMAEQARAANPDLLKEEVEEVEAEALEARTDTTEGHTDLTAHGSSPGGTIQVERHSDAVDGEMAGISDPEQVRADAAGHRAEKARKIADGGLVTGTGDGEDVPAGDPSAFQESHGMSPVDDDELAGDQHTVQRAKEQGEIEDDRDRDESVSENEPARGSLADGHSTDQGKDGANPSDDGPIGRDEEHS